MAIDPTAYDFSENDAKIVWSINSEDATLTTPTNTGVTLTGVSAGEVTITAEVYYNTSIGYEPFNTPIKDTFVVTVTSGT